MSSLSFAFNQLSGTVPAALSSAFPANTSVWASTCITGCTQPVGNCTMLERPFLVELFASSDTSAGGSTSTWFDQTTTPCSWKGVSCSSTGAITYVVPRRAGDVHALEWPHKAFICCASATRLVVAMPLLYDLQLSAGAELRSWGYAAVVHQLTVTCASVRLLRL